MSKKSQCYLKGQNTSPNSGFLSLKMFDEPLSAMCSLSSRNPKTRYIRPKPTFGPPWILNQPSRNWFFTGKPQPRSKFDILNVDCDTNPLSGILRNSQTDAGIPILFFLFRVVNNQITQRQPCLSLEQSIPYAFETTVNAIQSSVLSMSKKSLVVSRNRSPNITCFTSR